MSDYAAMNAKVRQFKSRLTRLKNKGDDAGILKLWYEFQEWCESPEGMWPDNWSNWQVAAEDAQWRLDRAWKTW